MEIHEIPVAFSYLNSSIPFNRLDLSFLFMPATSACPRLGFGLVADHDIGVREDLLQLHTEELGDEWCREVQDENLGVNGFA